MAQKRMFSNKIVESDDFLDMPHSSQLLYFHLGMYADDEGFVSPKKIMRILGSANDDLKVLVAKRFVLTFESGVVVIKHWLIHNTLKKDRFNPTSYQEERNILKVKENKAYTDNGNILETKRKHSIEKISIDKNRLDKNNTTAETADVNKIFEPFYKINPGINYGNKTTRKSAEWILSKFGLEKSLAIAEYACSIQGQKYAPTITTPYQLKEKLGELKVFSDRQKLSKESKLVEI